jgi:hypothetical protein
MALDVQVVGKRSIGDRRAQLVDLVFDNTLNTGESFTPEDAGLHLIDAVLPQPDEDGSGIWSVAFNAGSATLFLTDAAVLATDQTATVRALVVGI